MKSCSIFILPFLACISPVHAETYSVKSPDGSAVLELDCTEKSLSYSVSVDGKPLITSSPMSLLKDPAYKVVDTVSEEVDSTWKPVWGSFSEIRDHANRLTLKMDVSGLKVDLICQVYDEGIGMRFSVPEQEGLKGKSFEHVIAYNATGEFDAYSGAPGSSDPVGPFRSTELEKHAKKLSNIPFMMNLDDGPWVALLESDLYSAELFASARFSIDGKTIQNVAKVKAGEDAFITPWKVILWSEEPGGFLTNTVAHNLAAPCKLEDTSWVVTGKGLWDWRIHEYDNGDFKYGIDTRSYMRQIDFCAEKNIEYLTIDDHWFLSAKDGTMEISPEVDIDKVMAYAKDKGVDIMLYYDTRKGSYGDELIFDYYAKLGAKGIKYGFRGNNVKFTRLALRKAAEAKLMVFFHDGPTAMVGVERTMPHMISREYGHGQQDARKVFSPTGFLKAAMINGLSGPIDMSNGNFGIKSINAGERAKGPRIKGSYITTVVSEVARCIIINSGLVTLPDAPEEYRKKADLFDAISQTHATWDETIVPHSKMAEYLTVGRRSGDTWFLATVNNEEARTLEIPLDFLEEGMDYEVSLYEDTEETDGVRNPEAYAVSKKTVKAGDTLTAKMALGGGHVAILKPIN
ncbi:MAG: glycoside hydrolase family 97 protein [Akkermansiaceae bacterium]|jgi:glucan 1,4-alpha-glucosidase|nr:glycoside hydrolase family 97 protein [Akkermansiaceae bacterium]MDP4722096.1 glycoside hydrolase family 97 protein [Akkermansiaceae bacterium]MDP4781458.1 glycoside hydrolase family 97 protein [Akkermansiaceae bacterium]MDP4848091.1 glycoside hydrolase family 97 protein [Akkermansiaceae bacterium]MDP4899108.1 glycoside hydrolase family 97 protein [Akkermansiaceae bacterium]